MIYFVGEQEKGYFIPEVAQKREEKYEYSGFVSDLDVLAKTILTAAYPIVILHLPTLVVMDYNNIGQFCKNISIANSNIRLVVMAEGYNINSKIIQAAISAGVRHFMLGTNAAKLKQELTDALDDKPSIEHIFDTLPTEEQRTKKKTEIEEGFKSSRTIAVAGSQSRIGTTTQALQIVKHLLLQGFTACYIQLDSSDYVRKIAEFYFDAIDSPNEGLIQYQNIDMYYKQELITDILAKNYDYYVYDFGNVLDKDFTLMQFLEKDTKIIVCGSKANELPYMQTVLELMSGSNVEYVFSFTSETDRKDILDNMEDKKKHTHFADYVPDPFSYMPSSKELFSFINTDKPKNDPEPKRKFGFFSFGKKKKSK